MKISIAMCSYNGAKFLREQLDSISNQTRLPDEVVVCDDGSSDETLSIFESFSAASPFPVRVSVNEKNLGTLKNTERVIGLCEGDIIALCDQDDVWHPEKLASLATIFEASPHVGLVFTDADLIDDDSKPLGRGIFRHIRFDAQMQRRVTRGKALQVILPRNVVCGATMAYRSKFRPIILPIPTGGPLINDGWTVLLIAAAAKIAFIDKPLMQYRLHSSQQLGLTKANTAQEVVTATKTDPGSYLAHARQLEQAYERLAANRDQLLDQHSLSTLRKKIGHLHMRAAMPRQRVKRAPLILREVLNLHYHRYSQGFYSAAKDLLV
jgi:glycosyltransferase involved in cell wall biosynthesis